MEAVDLIKSLIAQLNEQIATREMVIKAMASGFVFMALTIGSFFFIYRKDKRKSDDRFFQMHNDLIIMMAKDTEAKIELRKSIENNTKVIEQFPSLIKDTISTTIKLAMKR